MSQLLHSTLGKYTLQQELGAGGMGAVYRSFHPQLNRPVAVKVILGNATDDIRQRFLREAQMASHLSHPNIVRVFDVDESNGIPYLVMELIEGPSLGDLIKRRPLAVDEIFRTAIQLAEALHYAHEQGVLHRDLKPANVLFRPNGDLVLVDFGLARPTTLASNDQLTKSGMIMGTLAYMSPEQLQAHPVDRRTDIYALGVMLYQMLTGRLPFDGDTAQVMFGHVYAAPPPPSSLGVPLLPELESLLARLLAKDPAARPQTAAEVAGALRSLQQRAGGYQPVAALHPTAPVAYQQPGTLPPNPGGQAAYAWGGQPQPTMQAHPPAAPGGNAKRIGLIAGIGGGLLAIAVAVAIAVGGGKGEATPVAGNPTAPPTATTAKAATSQPTDGPPDAPTEEPGEGPTSAAVLRGTPAAGADPITFSGVTNKRVKTLEGQSGIWFYGMLENSGDTARETPQITVTLYDADGKELDYETGYPSHDLLNPDERSPFLVIFSREVPDFASFELVIDSDEAEFYAGRSLHDFTVDAKVIDDSLGEKLRGTVLNNNEHAVQFVEIIIVFFNADNQVLQTASTYADTDDKPLPAGESARFEVNFYIDEPYDRYEIFVEATKVE